MADHVAKARGLAFSDAVKVVDVPAASYATTLATSVLGITDANKVSLTAEWRSLGLLSGPLDLAAIGAAAVPDAPAFYDPASKSVMVRAGLVEPARTFAVQRGLAAALLDQHFHWSTVAAGHSAGAAGSRALFDGDALHTAWNAMTPADVDGVQPLLDALRPDAGSPSPWASAMIGRPGLSLAHLDRSGAGDALAQAESAKIVSDRGIYDLMQDVAVALPLAVKDPTATRGMMYWYYVLAARVDSTTAWNAALHWTGDSVTTTSDGGAGCVTATVFGGDAGGADALQQAFAAWAAASPADMHAHSAVDGNKVNLGACDLGETVSAVVATPVSLGGAVLEADAVNAATRLAEVAPTAAQVACLTGVARMKSAGFTSPADDVPLLIPSAGWKSPYLAAATPTPSEVSDCTK